MKIMEFYVLGNFSYGQRLVHSQLSNVTVKPVAVAALERRWSAQIKSRFVGRC
jgi:hypothetical protein